MNEGYLKALGELIAMKREAEGLSLTKYSLMIGISRPTVYSIEDGRANPKFDTLVKIADGFGITLAELFLLCDAHMKRTSHAPRPLPSGDLRRTHYEHVKLPKN